MFSLSTDSIYQKFRFRRGSDQQANKQLLFELVRDDPRTLHAAYHPNPHTYEQYFIIASHKALLQAEQHTDGHIVIVIDYPQYGYFDYDSNSEDFMKHLPLF